MHNYYSLRLEISVGDFVLSSTKFVLSNRYLFSIEESSKYEKTFKHSNWVCVSNPQPIAPGLVSLGSKMINRLDHSEQSPQVLRYESLRIFKPNPRDPVTSG
jgi:hypothetical protein